MNIIIKILLVVIAFQHLYFLWLEMFVWETTGKKVFRSLPKHLFEPTRQLAANQGLYNGFLAAGMIWAVFISDPHWAINVAVFFLSCVIIAGVFGGYSVDKKIFLAQGLPALITLVLLHIL